MIQTPVLDLKTRKLFTFTPLQYMLDSLSEHPQMGSMYVDDEQDPRTGMILWGHYLFVGGQASASAVQALVSGILNDAVRKALQGVVVFYPDHEWRDLLTSLFPDRYQEAERSLYASSTLNHPSIESDCDPADSVTVSGQAYPDAVQQYDAVHRNDAVQRIDAALLQSSTANLDMIVGEVLGTATYADMNDFIENGIGFATVIQGQVCGFCTSEYPSRRSIAIGIEVLAAYQQQGYAKQMTRALLEVAAAQGLRVFWECWKTNSPSVRTALACGFTKISDYPVLVLDLT